MSEIFYNTRDLNLQQEILPIATTFINIIYENKEYQQATPKKESHFHTGGHLLFLI